MFFPSVLYMLIHGVFDFVCELWTTLIFNMYGLLLVIWLLLMVIFLMWLLVFYLLDYCSLGIQLASIKCLPFCLPLIIFLNLNLLDIEKLRKISSGDGCEAEYIELKWLLWIIKMWFIYSVFFSIILNLVNLLKHNLNTKYCKVLIFCNIT